MTAQDSSKTLFAGLPRRRRLGAAIAVGTWLVLAIAFLGDVASAPRGVEWLYGVEARRAEYARAFAAEQAARQAEGDAHARHAARATPPRARARIATAVTHQGEQAAELLPAPEARASAGLCSILANPAR